MKPFTLTLSAALASITILASGTASAAPTSELLSRMSEQTPQLIFGRDVADDGAVLEQAQFLWSGRNYCFYGSGWRGPGYYWCGYAFRRGYGWGGPMGWNGWSWRHGGPAGYRGGGYGHGNAGGHFEGGAVGHGQASGSHGGGPAGGGGHEAAHGGGGGGHGGGGHEGGGGRPH